MRNAVQLFEQDFARWGLQLPADAIAARRSGQIREAGWSLRFNFGCDGGGEYLDYYASPRDVQDDPPGDDWHVRLYESGERVEMPPVLEAYLYGRDPSWEELERARHPFERPGGPAKPDKAASDDGGDPADGRELDLAADLPIAEDAGDESANLGSAAPEREAPTPLRPDAPDPITDPFLASSSADIAYLPLDIGLDVELSLSVEPPKKESAEHPPGDAWTADAVDEIRPELEPLDGEKETSHELDEPELPTAELPTAELPTAELPSAEPHSAELPSAELPGSETPGPEVLSPEVLSPQSLDPEVLTPDIGIESTDDESFAAWLASPVTASEHADATQAPDAAAGLLRSDTEFSLDRLAPTSDAAAEPVGSLSLSRPEPRAPIESSDASEPEPIPPPQAPPHVESDPHHAADHVAAGHTPVDAEPDAGPDQDPERVLPDARESSSANPWEDIEAAPAPDAQDSAPAAKAVSRSSPEPRTHDRTVREGPSITGRGRRSRGMVIERAFGGTPLGLESITDAEILQPWWSRASNRRWMMGIAAVVILAIAVTTYLGLRSSHAHRSATQPDDAAAMDSGASSTPADSGTADPAASPDTIATPSRSPIGSDSVAVSRPATDSAAPEAPPPEEPPTDRNAVAQDEAVARPAGPGSVSPIISSRRPGRSLLRH